MKKVPGLAGTFSISFFVISFSYWRLLVACSGPYEPYQSS